MSFLINPYAFAATLTEPTFVDAGSGSQTAGTISSFTVACPATVASGNVLIAQVIVQDSSLLPTIPDT